MSPTQKTSALPPKNVLYISVMGADVLPGAAGWQHHNTAIFRELSSFLLTTESCSIVWRHDRTVLLPKLSGRHSSGSMTKLISAATAHRSKGASTPLRLSACTHWNGNCG